MIRHQDFTPQVTKRGPLGGAAELESFSGVVYEANQWIENNSIQVMNIETVVLVLPIGPESLADAPAYYEMRVAGGLGSAAFCQCIRVWYTE